jgi:mannose-6-phosphate isomerase-like protein (cupin superfamily)
VHRKSANLRTMAWYASGLVWAPWSMHSGTPTDLRIKSKPVQVIEDERNLVTLIANTPGTGSRPHWHKDFDEWWIVVAGRLNGS